MSANSRAMSRIMKTTISSFLVMLTAAFVAGKNADFWNSQAQATLRSALNRRPNIAAAKNVIFFLGDGFDVSTMTVARIYKGQINGRSGEAEVMSYERFPHVALTKTYNTDFQIADSSGTATALFCGVKTKFGVTGLDDRVERGDCSTAKGAEVDSLLVKANRKGKSTGFVTTTRVSHATPAALYSHSVDRNWESDAYIPTDQLAMNCTDITSQLVDDNSFINVILGGGRRTFLPNTTMDVEDGSPGYRWDRRDLIAEWLDGKDNAQYVWNQTAFDDVDVASTDYLLGLFQPSNMQYDGQRGDDIAGEPSIAEMTKKAIEILQKDEDGFFLMVEGGRIDHAHHEGFAIDAIKDSVAFEEAVAMAINMTSSDDTLIVVTADHAHVLTMGGYPTIGSDVFGFNDYENGTDGLPIPILSYANGPGGIKVQESYVASGKRPNHTNTDTGADGFIQDATYPLIEETHGGQDVSAHAQGPWAHLFFGVQEQNYIAHAVSFAACYDDDVDNACSITRPSSLPPMPCKATPIGSVNAAAFSGMLLLALLFSFMVTP